jgi:hypothetical protein
MVLIINYIYLFSVINLLGIVELLKIKMKNGVVCVTIERQET